MDNFILHTIAFITFDVSFVNDKTAPTVLTQDSELIFQKKVTVTLSESVYQGPGWDGIEVTDLNGNALNATVYIAHYPRNELKISFNNEAYKDGYILILPENALRDSSGNGSEAAVLTADPVAYLFPASTVQLPPAGYKRNNAQGHFFVTEEGFDVLTYLWESSPASQTNVPSAKLELMRLDHNGNVIGQYIVDNPIKNSEIEDVCRTDDGHYFVFCSQSDDLSLNTESIFCIDSQGNLKWKHEDFIGTNTTFSSYAPFHTTGGLVVRCQDRAGFNVTLMRFDTKTGEATPFAPTNSLVYWGSYLFFDIGNGQVLNACLTRDNKLQILDATTFQILFEKYVDPMVFGGLFDVRKNSDGTFLFLSMASQNVINVTRTDAGLNVLSTKALKRASDGYDNFFRWFYDDGFFIVERTKGGGMSHDNSQYHVTRYNKFLEVVWQTDIESNFFEFFRTADGGLMCYRSMFVPKRECYLDFYGSDAEYNPAHTHTLVYHAEKEANCVESGHKAFWQCADCGAMFSDEGNTVILSANDLFASNPGGHQYGESTITDNPTCQKAGWETRACTLCRMSTMAQIPANEKYHNKQWSTLKEATCRTDGILINACTECKTEFERQTIEADDKYHVVGEWTVTKAPTENAEGTESQLCKECNTIMATRSIAKLPPAENPTTENPTAPAEEPGNTKVDTPSNTIFIVVPIVIVAGVACAALLLRKKKRK